MPPRPSNHRAYGEDAYWIDRYERTASDEDDVTDEWLLGWAHLQPLLQKYLPTRGAMVLDLGCGTSTLCFDMLRDSLSTEGVVRAVDVAPAAIASLDEEKQRRIGKGEASAARCVLECADATKSQCWQREEMYDVVVDKSTTDGLLCDVRHGASRVRSIYEAIGRRLSPTAVVVIVSWRDPEAVGLEWVADLVLGSLCSGASNQRSEEDSIPLRSWWSIDIHSIAKHPKATDRRARHEHDVDDVTRGPHVYLVRRRPRRVLGRRTTGRQTGTAVAALDADEISVRQHVHEVCE